MEMIYHSLGLAEQRNELATAHIHQRGRRTDAHEAIVRRDPVPDAIELGKSEIRVVIKLLRGFTVCGEGLRRFIRVFMRVVDCVGAHSKDSLCTRVRDALRAHVEAGGEACDVDVGTQVDGGCSSDAGAQRLVRVAYRHCDVDAQGDACVVVQREHDWEGEVNFTELAEVVFDGGLRGGVVGIGGDGEVVWVCGGLSG